MLAKLVGSMLGRNENMPSNHKRNTEGLRNTAIKRSKETSQKVDKTIQYLIKSGQRINFNSVSEQAGVSKTYLYNHQDIRDRIEALRKKQEGLSSPKQVKHQTSEASKDVIIAAKNKRIKELDEENKKLKEELKKLRGKLYDSIN